MIKRGPTLGKVRYWSIDLPMKSYAVKIHNGRALIFDANTGVQLRSVGFNATGAQVMGDLVQVTTSNGRVEIYSAVTGVLQRHL